MAIRHSEYRVDIQKEHTLIIICAQLGGLHSNAYISDLLAQNFAKTGMKAYVEIVQRRERELGCDALTHQKVSLKCCLQEELISNVVSSGAVLIMLTTLSKR